MGFFDAMKKMVQGKPVFEVDQTEAKKWENSTPDPQQNEEKIHRSVRYNTADGRKIIPEACFTKVEPRYSGDNIEVWATAQNTSQYPIFLDKCYIFGVKQELDYPLQPGGVREFMIYRGKQRRDDSYKYAELYYKDEGSGDYFCAAHMIQYDHQSDGSYDIVDLDLIRPIKDV